MMIDAIYRKTQSLRNECAPHLLSKLEDAVSNWNDTPSAMTLRSGAFRALTLDVIYCFSRHATWVHTDAFAALVMEFLGTEYGLDRVRVESLISFLRAACGSLTENHPDASDEGFLRYLFVLGATARDERELLADLGLGAGVLRHLKRAADYAVSGRQEGQYKTGIDERIAHIMADLGEELRSNPYALDRHRLAIRLGGDGINLNGDRIHLDLLFSLLTRLGVSRGWTAAQVASWIAGRHEYPEMVEWLANQADPVDAGSRLLQVLEGKGLVYSVCSARGTAKWHLSEVGEDLTAEAFGSKFWQRSGSGPRVWEQFGPHIQAAVIRHMPQENIESQCGLLREGGFAGAPEAMAQVLKRCSATMKDDCYVDLLASALARSRNRVERETVCLASRYCDWSAPVQEFLERLAANQDFPDVRAIAMETIRVQERRMKPAGANAN